MTSGMIASTNPSIILTPTTFIITTSTSLNSSATASEMISTTFLFIIIPATTIPTNSDVISTHIDECVSAV